MKDDITKKPKQITIPVPTLPSVPKPDMSRVPKRRIGYGLGALLIFFAVSLGGGWLGAKIYNNNNSASLSKKTNRLVVSNESNLIASIAKDVGPAVVSVDVSSQVTTPDYFGFGGSTSSQQSAGTGFIIDKSGIVLTNRHVVPDGTSSVSVTLSDGTKIDNVQVLGRTSTSSSLDVAFLKIPNASKYNLTVATLGDSKNMQVGDKVIAIGNALGQFQNTVTSGIISGYGRDIQAGDASGTQSGESLTDLFQTDAAINEGNSGGPLVNINGEVIGINTAVAGNAQNIGFSIPIDDVKGLISGVIDTGKLSQPYLGVRYISLTDDIAYQLNLDQKRGAYIAPNSGSGDSILSGSPAEKAGLKEKDIITKIDGTTIDDKTSLTSVLSKHKVGDTVSLTVVRDGKTINLKATLEAAPASN